jgi:TrmH family RNA methyltransferase
LITSRQNPIVKRFREAAGRADPFVLLDGVHVVSAALEAGWPIELAAVRTHVGDTDAASEIASLVRDLRDRATPLVSVSGRVMEALSPVRAPSQIVALAPRPSSDPNRLLAPAPALVLVAMDVQEPGNLGAIIRAADAAGASGVVATAGGADAFGWKAVRGSMGSALRLPVWSGAAWPEVVSFVRQHGLWLVAAVPRAPMTFFDAPWDRPTAVLLGSEGQGLPESVAAAADTRISIPMCAGVESLNVAVAAGLIAYEARRMTWLARRNGFILRESRRSGPDS